MRPFSSSSRFQMGRAFPFDRRTSGGPRRSPHHRSISRTSSASIARGSSRATDVRHRAPRSAFPVGVMSRAPATAPWFVDRVRARGAPAADGPSGFCLTGNHDARHRPTVYEPGATAGRCRQRRDFTFPSRHTESGCEQREFVMHEHDQRDPAGWQARSSVARVVFDPKMAITGHGWRRDGNGSSRSGNGSSANGVRLGNVGSSNGVRRSNGERSVSLAVASGQASLRYGYLVQSLTSPVLRALRKFRFAGCGDPLIDLLVVGFVDFHDAILSSRPLTTGRPARIGMPGRPARTASCGIRISTEVPSGSEWAGRLRGSARN